MFSLFQNAGNEAGFPPESQKPNCSVSPSQISLDSCLKRNNQSIFSSYATNLRPIMSHCAIAETTDVACDTPK